MPRSKEIPEETRKKIIDIHKSGKGYTAISKTLGLNRTTVRAIISKWKLLGTVVNRPRSGRPAKIFPRPPPKLVRKEKNVPQRTSNELQVLIESAKESLQELGQKLSRKISRTEKFLRQHGEAEHRNQRFVEGAEQHLRVVGEQMEELLRQFLSALHACLLAHSRAGPGAGLQLRYNKIMEDWARLQQAQISLQSLLQENDPFQFVQEYLSTRKRLRKALRTQPFSPGSVRLDAEALAKVMEAKLQEFQTEFRLQIADLIRTVCAQNSGEEEEEAGEEEEEVVEEEEDDDSESDEEEDGVHDVEANEGAEDDDQSGSAGDVYDPEEEGGEEGDSGSAGDVCDPEEEEGEEGVPSD